MLKGSVFQNKYQKHDVSDFSESAEAIQGQILNDTPSLKTRWVTWFAFSWSEHSDDAIRPSEWGDYLDINESGTESTIWWWSLIHSMLAQHLLLELFFFLLKNVLRNSFLLNKASNATSKNKTKNKQKIKTSKSTTIEMLPLCQKQWLSFGRSAWLPPVKKSVVVLGIVIV